MLREERTGASGRPFDVDARPVALDEDGTRQALLDAGLDLFTERGFENVTTVDLCAHVHLDHAAFDALYTDTAHLFADVYDTIHQEVGAAIVRALDRTDELAARGRERIEDLSWERTARETAAVYAELA